MAKATAGNREKTANKQGRKRRGNPEQVSAFRFKPGQSGNPSGRPRDVVSIVIRDMMPSRCPLDTNGRTWEEAVAFALFKKAIRGDVRAASELLDRAEGKARQSVDIAASGEFKITHGLTVEDCDRQILEIVNRALERERRRRSESMIDVPSLAP